MFSTATGRRRPSAATSYRTDTCALPSGRRYGSTSALRTSDRRLQILCASMIGSGISSGVSFDA